MESKETKKVNLFKRDFVLTEKGKATFFVATLLKREEFGRSVDFIKNFPLIRQFYLSVRP